MYRKNSPQPECIFSGAKFEENVKKMIFGLKCLYRNSCTEVIPFLVLVKLQCPLVVAYSRAGATKTLGFLRRNLTLPIISQRKLYVTIRTKAHEQWQQKNTLYVEVNIMNISARFHS